MIATAVTAIPMNCRWVIFCLLLALPAVARGNEADVRNLMGKTVAAFQKGEYRRALQFSNAALAEQPVDRAAVLYSRGLIYANLKDDDKALLDFSEAIRLSPRLTVAYLDRGLAYIRRGLNAKAMADYNRAIALEPRNARAFRDRADLEDNMRLWDDAIRDYTTALRWNPKLADALNNRAGIFQQRGEYEKAVADYRKYLELDPAAVDVACNLAKCYTASGDLPRAIAGFSRVIQAHPKYIPAYSSRALAYLKQGNRAAALADARRGAALTPADDWDFYSRSRLDEILNDDRKALSDLRAALRGDPNSDLYLNLTAWLLATSPDASLRDGREAVRLAMKANESTGWRAASRMDTLAAAYAESGNFGKAVEYQERACKMKSTDSIEKKERQARLELYRTRKPYRKPQDNSLHEP